MPTLPSFLRPFAAALLLVGIAAAQTPAPRLPEFAGHDAAWWDEQLKNDLAAREQLAVGAAEAMPLLRWLFDNGNEYARYSAAAALTRLGPGAKPMWDALFARLRDTAGKWPDNECAHALVAIGEDRDELRELLLQHVTRSDHVNLRTACSKALATLRSDAAEMLLGAAATGAFAEPDWAIQALQAAGEKAVPAMLAALDAEGERGRAARETLVLAGWPVAAQLDEAGHAELAHRALTEGALRYVTGTDQYRILPLDAEPPAQQLPELEAALGSGHGQNLQVWRGAEGARGYVLRKVGVVGTYDNERKQKQWQLSCEQATVPRELALGMTRQLRLLARLELQLRGEKPETWWSSGNFAAAVRLQAHGETWFDAGFVGYPQGSNVPQRYRAQAASQVLYQLAHRATWEKATPDEGDRAAVVSRHQACGGGWSGERFVALEDLLASQLPGQTPTPKPAFAGHDAAWWNEHLDKNPAAGEQLAAGGAEAMPLLRWLLENGKDWSRASALDALTRMGPGAKPMWDMLFARLRDCDGKWPDTLCARALVAIGEDRDDLRELLLRHITRSGDITLRSVCSEALATLRPDVDALLLDAAAAGKFADEAWAIQLLVARGEHAVPALLAELDADGARGRVAREALVQHGWTIADRLEAAGHAELAHRALTEWLLPAAPRDGEHELVPLAPEPPAQHLPELLASTSSRRGRHLSVWRGEESARGYRLRKVELEFVNGDEEGEGEWQLNCRESVVSRELALGMTRQLALLARAELTPRDPDNPGWTSSDTFAVSVRATTAGERWLDESFVGTRNSGNEPQRFRAGAPHSVVSKLAGLAEWHDAKLDDADRAAVASCRAQFADDAWLEERFAALEELLKR